MPFPSMSRQAVIEAIADLEADLSRQRCSSCQLLPQVNDHSPESLKAVLEALTTLTEPLYYQQDSYGLCYLHGTGYRVEYNSLTGERYILSKVGKLAVPPRVRMFLSHGRYAS